MLRGEAGVGKTALLDYLASTGSGCRVVRASGVESEMELAVRRAAPAVRADARPARRLPGPQRDALGTAFGLAIGEAAGSLSRSAWPCLSLLSAVAEEQPLVCVVDDAQWLDRRRRRCSAFVARRLLAESVALVFAVREPERADELWPGCRSWRSTGSVDGDARALLDSVDRRAGWTSAVRDRIVAETRGNPLALLELPRGLTAGELAGGFGLPEARPLAGPDRAELRRGGSRRCPRDDAAAAAGRGGRAVGDASLLWRAAERLGIGPTRRAPAEAAG